MALHYLVFTDYANGSLYRPLCPLFIVSFAFILLYNL